MKEPRTSHELIGLLREALRRGMPEYPLQITFPPEQQLQLSEILDAAEREAARAIGADQPAATETAPLGVGEIADMLTTARAPDRCTPFEHEVTGLPFEAETAPQGDPLKCKYHPIYRECVRCGGAMNRGDDIECPGQSAKEVGK